MKSELTGHKPTDVKACTKCREVKPLDDFHRLKTSKTGRHTSCKKCRNTYYVNRYKKDPELRAKANASAMKSYKEAKKRQADYIAHRGGRCEHCKRSYPPEIFEFHHLNPEDKESGLDVWKWSGNIYIKTLEEVERCAMLCPTCHRVTHYELRKGKHILGEI